MFACSHHVRLTSRFQPLGTRHRLTVAFELITSSRVAVMSSLIVPYHEAMDIGQGYNSYTQTTCLIQAVTFGESTRPISVEYNQENSSVAPKKFSQNIIRLAHFADKPSDIIRTLGLSAASCIRDGVMGYSETDVRIDMATVHIFRIFLTLTRNARSDDYWISGPRK